MEEIRCTIEQNEHTNGNRKKKQPEEIHYKDKMALRASRMCTISIWESGMEGDEGSRAVSGNLEKVETASYLGSP